MKYIRMWCETGYCGCDGEDYVYCEDDLTDKQIDEDVSIWANNHASSFEYMCIDEDLEGEELEEATEEYYENVTWGWEEITEEEYKEETGWQAGYYSF